MNDKEKHDALARFIYMHESTKIPVGRTEEEWGKMRLRMEKKAHELARPILLEMVREYSDRELASIDGVCEPPLRAEASLHDDEEDPILGVASDKSQEHEALEEAWLAYHGMDAINIADGQVMEVICTHNEDSQFLKHVHALRKVLFVKLRKAYMTEFEQAVGWHDGPSVMAGDYLAYRKMRDAPQATPLYELAHMAKVAMIYVGDTNFDPFIMLAYALDRMFKEVHDV